MSKKHKLNTGDKFNDLTVIKFLKSENNQRIWECKCVCGNIINISAYKLVNNLKKSCGCLHSKVLIKRNTKHGLCNTQLYIVFKSIKGRCLNPKNKRYHYYGGRSIKLYNQWINNPEKFVEYINNNLGPRPSLKHSLDRINNNGHYEPGNLRWATQHTQVYNSRRFIKNEHPTSE